MTNSFKNRLTLKCDIYGEKGLRHFVIQLLQFLYLKRFAVSSDNTTICRMKVNLYSSLCFIKRTKPWYFNLDGSPKYKYLIYHNKCKCFISKLRLLLLRVICQIELIDKVFCALPSASRPGHCKKRVVKYCTSQSQLICCSLANTTFRNSGSEGRKIPVPYYSMLIQAVQPLPVRARL